MSETGAIERPLWRRIVDFPLVAMLIGAAVIMVGIAIAVIIDRFVLPRIPGLTREMSFEVIASATLIILYKLVIRRLGEYPRDDLRLTGSFGPCSVASPAASSFSRWPLRSPRRSGSIE